MTEQNLPHLKFRKVIYRCIVVDQDGQSSLGFACAAACTVAKSIRRMQRDMDVPHRASARLGKVTAYYPDMSRIGVKDAKGPEQTL